MAGGASTITNTSFTGSGQLGANAGSVVNDANATASASRTAISSAANNSRTAAMQKVQSTAASVVARIGRR